MSQNRRNGARTFSGLFRGLLDRAGERNAHRSTLAKPSQSSVTDTAGEPPIELPNPPDGENGTVLEEVTKVASRDALGG